MTYLRPVLDFFVSIPWEYALISIFIVALISERIGAYLANKPFFSRKNTRQNLLIGGISLTVDALFSFFTLPILAKVPSLFQFNSYGIGYWISLFLFLDFVEYWFHRLSHSINFMWAAHVVHHQCMDYNLTTGLRTSVFMPLLNIGFYAIFPLLGFSAEHLMIMVFLQGVFQLFVHTRFIGNLGVLEYVFVTPSAHRVHHGSNELYLDKNFGKVLIFWDFLFKSYQAEVEEVSFGVKGKSESKSVFTALFKPYKDIFQELSQAESVYQKIEVLIGKPK